MYYRYPKVMKKGFNWSEVHLSEVTSYKIQNFNKKDICINLQLNIKNQNASSMNVFLPHFLTFVDVFTGYFFMR